MVTILLAAPAARAGNVDLTTLPPRAAVELTIYNSEDLTLVRERRVITFKRGANKIQFSWAGTLIDPTSLEFRVRKEQGKVQLVDATFPAARPEVVIWNVESEIDGEIECEVSYFTSGLSWAMDYVGIADAAEKAMRFDGFVTVLNRSGEDYEGASVRLVVGVVNLVEKIRDLAARRGIPVPESTTRDYHALRKDAAKMSLDRAGEAAALAGEDREKMVVKEGLSEYFIFSIEGQEDVPNGWSKRMRAVKTERPVPFDVLYRVRDYQYGPAPARFLLWKNDKEHGLGESPLPDGVIRLFREFGKDGLTFLGQEAVKYVPVKQDVEVNVGADPEVVYEPRLLSVARHDFVFRRDGNGDEYVIGWRETKVFRERIRNYRDRPVRFEIRRRVGGDVELTSSAAPRQVDANTVEWVIEVAPREAKEISYTLLVREGESAKQNRVLIK
jgi:hypothetical protein